MRLVSLSQCMCAHLRICVWLMLPSLAWAIRHLPHLPPWSFSDKMPSPSSSTPSLRSCIVTDDERDLLAVEARSAYERAVAGGLRHDPPDAARLHAPAPPDAE